MDWQIRIAIIIVGAIVIGFIIYDYKRRKKSQAEKENLIKQMHESANQVDSAGFDFTGVGNVRKAGKEPTLPDDSDLSENLTEDLSDTVRLSDAEKHSPEISEPVVSNFNKKNNNSPTEQLDLVADESDEPDYVLSLILKAEQDKLYKGSDFMPLLLSQGLRHGDMGIFHRHSGASGKPGPKMYSVANAIHPGTFELQDIQNFETPAFAFFMTIPGPEDPIMAFEGMVKTIRLLKEELGGQILDESKSVYTEQTYRHQHESLREYLTKKSLR